MLRYSISAVGLGWFEKRLICTECVKNSVAIGKTCKHTEQNQSKEAQ